ncbi:MAG: hypothetical protein Kow0069_27080 [Promethearchaeota archaeon]
MFVADPLQVQLIVPKVVQCAGGLLLARTMAKKADESRYVLSRVFAALFGAWALVAACDAVMYPIAANGPGWLVVANLLRDVAAVGLFSVTLLSFVAAQVIRSGTQWFSRGKTAATVAAFVALAAAGVAFDRMAVVDSATGQEIAHLPPTTSDFRVTAVITFPVVLVYLVNLGLITYGVLVLFASYRSEDDPVVKCKSREVTAGLALLLVGYYYFLVLTSLGVRLAVLYWGGYLLWLASPALVYRGIRPR